MKSLFEKSIFKKSFEFYCLAFLMLENLLLCWYCKFTVYDGNTFILEANLMLMAGALVLSCLIRLLRKCKALEAEGKKVDIKAVMPEFDYILIFLLMLALIGVISAYFAIDRDNALYGEFGRDEGLFALLAYYIFFVAASKIKEAEQKHLLVWFLLLGIAMCFVGTLSGWGVFNEISAADWQDTAYFPLGNPNFYGTFASTVFACSVGFFMYSQNRAYRILGVVGVIISTGAVFACNSSSPLVGNFMVFFYLLVYEITKSVKKIHGSWGRFLVVFGSYISVMLISNFTRHGAVFAEFFRNKAEITGEAEFQLSGRLGVWKAAFSVMPKYWLSGVGIDCFKYAMASDGVDPGLLGFDKAHNEYIQIMTTEGIFAIAIYLVFLFALFFRSRRYRVDNLEKNNFIPLSLFLVFISYLAQAFFNISVPWVAIYFWILLGMLSVQGKKTIRKPAQK